MLLRSLVLSVLTIGSGAFLYWLFGVSTLPVALFALACGIASVLVSFIV